MNRLSLRASRLAAMNPGVESTCVTQCFDDSSTVGNWRRGVNHLIICIENRMPVPSCTWQLQEEFKLEGEQMAGV